MRPRAPQVTGRAAMVAALVALAGCTGTGGHPAADDTAPASSPAPSTSSPAPTPPQLQADHRTSEGTVPFGHRVALHPTQGEVTSLTVHTEDGSTVQGQWNDGHTRWRSRQPIPAGTTWDWSATGPHHTHAQGDVVASKATRKVNATANIGVDRVVGVAAPIIVDFHAKVLHKASVQRHLKVLVRPQGSDGPWKPARGAWAWLPDRAPNSTAHFRTKEYWPAHSQVRVVLPLANLDWGDGLTGTKNLDWTFTIGRSQVVKADARTHHIVVYRDGKKVATYPASYGLDSQLNRNTRSGISIVTEKFKDIEMKSELFDYDLMEHWAVRINNNGEFIHANPETVQWQGKKNVSHGCINLSTKDAKAYFKTAIYGDPVEVSGTRTKLSDSRTELYDWALSWKQWTAMSALPQA